MEMIKIEFQYERGFWMSSDPHPYSTTCVVTLDGDRVLMGTATCHEEDQFCKRIGRRIALKRAIESLPKNERKKIWEIYLNRGKK
jgi:hypothetical protein